MLLEDWQSHSVCEDPLLMRPGIFGYLLPLDDPSNACYIYQEIEGEKTIIAYVSNEGEIGEFKDTASCKISSFEPGATIYIKDRRRGGFNFVHTVGVISSKAFLFPNPYKEHATISKLCFGIDDALYTIYPRQDIDSIYALCVYIFLIWGSRDISIAPLEYDGDFVLDSPIHSLEDILVPQNETEHTPGLVSMAQEILSLKHRIDADTSEGKYSWKDYEPFEIKKNELTGLFKLETKERGFENRALVQLQSDLNSAFIADALLQNFPNEEFKNSSIAFILAKQAAFRRIHKRVEMLVNLDLAYDMLSHNPTKYKKQLEYLQELKDIDEYTGRIRIAKICEKTLASTKLEDFTFALNMSKREAVIEFALAPASNMPLVCIDPRKPGRLRATPKELLNKTYIEYSYGIAFLYAYKAFQAVPSLEKLTVNLTGIEALLENPEYKLLPPAARADESSYKLSIAIDRSSLSQEDYFGSPHALSVILAHGQAIETRAANELGGDGFGITPLKSVNELNDEDLYLDLPDRYRHLDQLRKYELSAEESEAFAILSATATSVAENLGRDFDSDIEVLNTLLKTKKAFSKILAKFTNDSASYISFESLRSYVIYQSLYDVPEGSLVIPNELSDFYYALGIAASNIENYNLAWEFLSMTLRLGPAEASTYLELAWLSYKMKDYETMNRYLEEAANFVCRDDDTARIYFYLGILAREQNNLTKAALLFKLSQRWLASEVVADALEEIEQLTNKTDGSINEQNIEFLFHHYNIPNYPKHEVLDTLHEYLKVFVNARRFNAVEDIVNTLIPFELEGDLKYLIAGLPDYRILSL